MLCLFPGCMVFYVVGFCVGKITKGPRNESNLLQYWIIHSVIFVDYGWK